MATDALVRRTSLTVLCLCVFLVGLTLAGVGLASVDRTGFTGYRQGEVVDLPSDSFVGRGDTLLVFLRSDCAASQALVASLSDVRASLPAGVRLRAVVSNDVAHSESTFAAAAGFERSSIVSVDFRALRLRVVPSLVLVNHSGVVKLERVGAGAGRHEALAAMSGSASGS
jgi:hypothetical protein